MPTMPPILDQDRYASYTVAAPTTNFAFPFPLFGKGDLKVLINGTVVDPTAYTVTSASYGNWSLAPNPVTDTVVVLNTAVSSGTVEIFGSIKPQRAVQATAAFTTFSFNYSFSYLVACLRELYSQFTRAIQAPVGESSLILPTKAARSGQVLGFDTNGNPAAVGDYATISTGAAAATAAAASAAASAAAAQTWDPSNYYTQVQADARYYTQAQADARYYTQSAVATIISSRQSKWNRHPNSAMQVCQDRLTGATIAINSPAYVFDGVSAAAVGGGVLTCSQVSKVSPGGSPYRFRAVVTTVDASLASTDYYAIVFPIEGIDVADLQFGTANAKSFVWRGQVNMPAGNYALSFGNSDGTRSYVVPFTISAGQAGNDTFVTATVNGDTAGTWVKDASGAGIYVRICLAAGTGLQTANASVWQAGNNLATTAQTNGVSSVSATFEVCDIGFYEGTYLPTWQMPDYNIDILRCQRYFRPVGEGWVGVEEDTTHFSLGFDFDPMRTVPSLSLLSTTVSTRANPGIDRVISGCSINTQTVTQRGAWVFLNCSGGNSAGRFIQSRDAAPIFAANARF